MSGYSDTFKDEKQAYFLAKWTPDLEDEDGDLRWNIARARAAEARVDELEGILRGLAAALRSV